MNQLIALDRKIYLACHGFSSRNETFRRAVNMTTKLSSKVFFVIYGLGILYLALTLPYMLIYFLGIPGFTLGLVSLLRDRIKRPRPFDTLKVKPSLSHESGGSFPSKHSSSAMIIALSFFLINPSLALLLIGLACITGASRVFTGVHYPMDVLAGQLIAVLTWCWGIFIM